MKLEWLRADIASARRATTFLALLLTGSLLVNVVLAILSVRLSGRERVVLVPPTIHKTFWVESERVSAEYLQQMAYFLMQLTLDVTPHSVDHQASVLMQYAAPASFGELRTAMAATADRLKRDGASTVFSARDLVVDEVTQRVGVRESEDMYRCILGKNRQPSSAAAAAVHVADTRRTQVAQTLETRPPRALEMASCSLKKLARLLPKNAPEKTHDDER